MPLFKKILIANRGEIACRIMRTAKRMGIDSVAVYSDPDRHSLHVKMADEAVAIGGATSAESYLRIDAIIDACKQTGAEAVHPGFGFLSENAEFAQALEKAGIRFIGPNIRAIEVMGDKIESKKLAATANVNTVPGHTEALDSPQQALQVATDIGCPVMLKASAGGGGKGMRIAWTLDEVENGFSSAQSEAISAFGDDRVFVEKYIERPRHIEIQVLADTQGNCIALGERECSIQRRHQKVLEEAPSPFLDSKTREAMSEQAVTLARAVDYQSAGTVEFIVNKDREFFFLEMNTRLQVEHPVTELVTGLDLVEQMIRVAAGETLPIKQSDVQMHGWAIEARVYAEDPDRNFMPSIGRLTHYQPPAEGDAQTLQSDDSNATVRVDTGVFEGGEISMYYDPMIAKLVTHANTREAAIDAMSDALDRYVIRGVNHNIAFLNALVNHPAFRKGDLTTGFIDEHYPDGFSSSVSAARADDKDGTSGELDTDIVISIAAFAQAMEDCRAYEIDNQLRRTRELPGVFEYIALNLDKNKDKKESDLITVERRTGERRSAVIQAGNTAASSVSFSLTCNGQTQMLESDWTPGQLLFEGTLTQSQNATPRRIIAQVDHKAGVWVVTLGGKTENYRVMRPSVAALLQLMPEKTPPDLSRFLLSPMPGLLIKVFVNEGEAVKAGQDLAVVEAMKMENMLTAQQDGVVKSIKHDNGASLSVDEVIMEFE